MTEEEDDKTYVWTLDHLEPYEPSYLVGIYATQDLAFRAAKKYIAETDYVSEHDLSICKEEVIQELPEEEDGA